VDDFAHDHMGPDELERRIGAASAVGSVRELRALIVDLPGGSGGARLAGGSEHPA
jgi:hypothetical protein